MVYSPLEQFEPVSLFSIFFGRMNLSITNISLLFIFIIVVFIFLVNGYLFYFDGSKNTVKFNVNNKVSYVSNSFSHSNFVDEKKMILHSNKEISYINQLNSNFLSSLELAHYKFIKSNVSSGLSHKFMNMYLKAFYSLLKTGSVSVNKGMSFSTVVPELLRLSTKKSSSTLFNFLPKINSDTNFKRLFVPTVLVYILENIYDFILDQVKSVIEGDSKVAVRFFPLVFVLFNFILLANVLGLIPYSSTVTAYLIVTLTLAVMILVGRTAYAFRQHGLHFFSFFLPSGVPVALWPVLITIELLSYLMTVISLSVRLFANMMAGHTLLGVFTMFGWGMATSGILYFLLHPFPILIAFVLVGLELAVAGIQAFVFALLVCIYLNEAINLH